MWKQQETPIKPPLAVQPEPPPRAAAADIRHAEKVEETRKPVMDFGRSMIIKGDLSASEDLTLCGQMEGSVRLTDHTLTIGAGADIRAEVTARAVVILGAITGNVVARERVEIRAGGSVTGDIAAPRLAIADGGCLNGRIEMPHPLPSKGQHTPL